MKNITIPFSLYDFFAILLPGFAGIFGIYFIIDPSLAGLKQLPLKDAGEVIEILFLTGLILVSYFAGHFLNSFSEILIDKPANKILGWQAAKILSYQGLLRKIYRKMNFFGREINFRIRAYEWVDDQTKYTEIGKSLIECTDKQFGPISKEWSFAYVLIRAYVVENIANTAAEAKVYIANSMMFTSLCLATLLIGAGFVRGFITGVIEKGIFWFGLVALVLMIVMFFASYRRYKRFWFEALYAGFVAHVKPTIEKSHSKENFE